MITTPIKGLAAAREKPAQSERTAATELPQELSQLPGQYGFSDESSFLKGDKSAAHGGRKKPGRPKKAAAITTATGFTDDGHPTILAAARGLIPPS